MKKFLVYEKNVKGPATHAIVIGVGKYRHLKGGGGRFSQQWSAGMEQLLSPPRSARSFVDWLLKSYNPPRHKLATVALLISDKETRTYKLPSGGELPVERANTANVVRAIKEWDDRANSGAENLTVFYFCGHGTLAGSDTSLLLEDYAKDDRSPLDGAIDFSKFHQGMDKCAARRQVYFIDACRIPTPAALTADKYLGNIVRYGDLRPSRGEARQTCVYYSALRGKAAYSRNKEISQFTEMLLRSLSSAAGNYDGDGKWRINTLTLLSGINGFLERAAEKRADVRQNTSSVLDVFNLHELKQAPAVPVFVYCNPRNAGKECMLSCSGPTFNGTYELGEDWGWDLQLPRGDYTFVASSASDPAKRGKAESRPVQPTHARVEVEVKNA